MASKKAGRDKKACEAWKSAGIRIKNAKRKMEKRIARMSDESKTKIRANTKFGRKGEKA